MITRSRAHGLYHEQGSVTNAWWDGPYFHPRTWQAKDISATLIDQLRKSNHGFEATEGIVCNYMEALQSLLTVFPSLQAPEGKIGRRRALQQVHHLPYADSLALLAGHTQAHLRQHTLCKPRLESDAQDQHKKH